MLSTVPFSGFYSSWHDAELDDALNQMFSNENGDPYEKLVEKAYFDCNWQQVHQNYAKAYVENFAASAGLKTMKPDKKVLSSPREYNFTTDRVFAQVSRDEVRKIFKECDKDALTELAKQEFTSRDGFSSSYNPNWRTWGRVDKWDHNQLGCLIAARIEGEFGQSQEFELMERDRGNGMLERWIGDAIPNVGRLYNICDYLRKREARK